MLASNKTLSLGGKMESVNNYKTKEVNLAKFSTLATTNKHEDLSNKYQFASTADILTSLRSQGWDVTQYLEARTLKEDKKGFQKHSVVLANARLEAELQVAGTLPRLMIVNSHDGKSSLQLKSGLFEKICANGLIVGNMTEDMRILHTQLNQEKIVECVNKAIEGMIKGLVLSDKMKAIKLDKQQRINFAEKAIDMAFDGEKYVVHASSLIHNHRYNQSEPTLWNTFNTIQEHVIRGGVLQYREDGTRIRSRAVNNIQKNIKLNSDLWNLATSMIH